MPNAATVQIIGHVVADAEARFSKSGSNLTNFRVAVNQGYGEKKTTGWYGVICFGKTAEWAAQNIKKGNAVFVAGELNMEEWVGKDGHKNISPNISAHTIQSLEKREKKDGRTDGEKAADNSSEIPF